MLTEKELQVLLLRAEGLLQKEIAGRLHITQGAISRFEARAREKIQDALTDLAVLEELGIEHGQKPLGARQLAEQARRWRQ